MGQLALYRQAQWIQGIAAIEVDALEPRARLLVEQLNKGFRVGQVDQTVGKLEGQSARQRALFDRIAVTRELQASWR